MVSSDYQRAAGQPGVCLPSAEALASTAHVGTVRYSKINCFIVVDHASAGPLVVANVAVYIAYLFPTLHQHVSLI